MPCGSISKTFSGESKIHHGNLANAQIRKHASMRAEPQAISCLSRDCIRHSYLITYNTGRWGIYLRAIRRKEDIRRNLFGENDFSSFADLYQSDFCRKMLMGSELKYLNIYYIPSWTFAFNHSPTSSLLFILNRCSIIESLHGVGRYDVWWTGLPRRRNWLRWDATLHVDGLWGGDKGNYCNMANYYNIIIQSTHL